MTNDEISDNITNSIDDWDMEKELTPKQQTSEAIRQAESILILTGQRPSVDQVSAVVALGSVLRKFGKKVTTTISDELPAGAKFMPLQYVSHDLGGLRDFIVQVGLDHAEVDKLKYTIENGKLNVHISPFAGGFKSDDVSFAYGDYHYDLILVLGVASYARIDKVYAQNQAVLQQIPVVNIDTHRSNEQYGAINLVEPQAAGLGELLVALSESLQTGLIDQEIATVLLAGIMSATDRFTASHTTSKALTVAAQMMAMGADQQVVVRGLYRSGDRSGNRTREQQKDTDRQQRQPVAKSTPIPAEARPTAKPEAVAPAAAPVAPKQPAPVEPTPQPQFKPAPEALPEPVVQTQPAPQPAATLVPAPVQQNPVQAAPELETDGPAVTDPENPEPVQQEAAPEPLINDTESVAPAAPQQPKPAEKATNPANNPIFANRLPW